MTDDEKPATLADVLWDTIAQMHAINGVPRLFVNMSHPGLVMPERLKGSPAQAFDLQKEYPLFMEKTETALEVSLAFQGETVRCVIPWASIFRIVERHTGKGIMFAQNAPAESGVVAGMKPSLRVVKGGQA
jgi:stringent starvation protein B